MDISQLLSVFASSSNPKLSYLVWKVRLNSFYDDVQKITLWPTPKASRAALAENPCDVFSRVDGHPLFYVQMAVI